MTGKPPAGGTLRAKENGYRRSRTPVRVCVSAGKRPFAWTAVLSGSFGGETKFSMAAAGSRGQMEKNRREKPMRQSNETERDPFFDQELEQRIRRLEDPGFQGVPPMRGRDYRMAAGLALACLAALIAGAWIR